MGALARLWEDNGSEINLGCKINVGKRWTKEQEGEEHWEHFHYCETQLQMAYFFLSQSPIILNSPKFLIEKKENICDWIYTTTSILHKHEKHFFSHFSVMTQNEHDSKKLEKKLWTNEGERVEIR